MCLRVVEICDRVERKLLSEVEKWEVVGGAKQEGEDDKPVQEGRCCAHGAKDKVPYVVAWESIS